MKYFHIPCPRVINVDDNPSNQKVVAELKRERKLGRRYRCRACPYLKNIVEQDHPSDQKPRQPRPFCRSQLICLRLYALFELVTQVFIGSC